MKALIFGCGYLGSRVAEIWQRQNNQVSVVTRTNDNADHFLSLGYQPIVADITNAESLANISTNFDVVLFAVGFDRSRYSDIRQVYVDGLKNVLEQLKGSACHFIYISSTGVFGDCKGEWIDETATAEPIRPGGKACLEAEQLVSEQFKKHTILRLAGIYGPGRIPRLQAIRDQAWGELGQQGHINLIHVTDAAGIVVQIAENKIVGEMFLVSDGQPADRKQFYEFIAGQVGAGPIDWAVQTRVDVSRRSAADKKISNEKLLKKTSYPFRFPNFRIGIVDAISHD